MPVTERSDGMVVAVRLTPRAGRTAILGLAAEADGGWVVKAAVTAPPENGKANAALVALLAKTWKVPKGAISVIQGQTDRRKLLHVKGTPEALRIRLDPWLAGLRSPP